MRAPSKTTIIKTRVTGISGVWEDVAAVAGRRDVPPVVATRRRWSTYWAHWPLARCACRGSRKSTKMNFVVQATASRWSQTMGEAAATRTGSVFTIKSSAKSKYVDVDHCQTYARQDR